MKELMIKLKEINNTAGTVILQHRLFGEQKISVDRLQTFCDDRVGLKIKGQEIFIPLNELESYSADDNKLIISSNIKKIIIKKRF